MAVDEEPTDRFVPIPDRPGPLAQVLDALGALDRRRSVPVLVALAVIGGALLGGYLLLRTPAPPPTELLLPRAGAGDAAAVPAAPAATVTTAVDELVVHAAGAVAAPGVHRVPPGSRVADLLAAAGGPSADADLDRVNLAAALVDGERVWFPRVGEDAPPPVGGAVGAPAGAPAAPGPVDVNTATVEQLDELPGIGPAIAAAIVEHRERTGRFRTVEDLLDVPGIGDAKLARLRDLVTAG